MGESEAKAKAAMELFVNSIATRTTYADEGAKYKVGDIGDSLKGAYTTDEAWAELGGNRESRQFDMKMLVLTNPTENATMRATALGQFKAETEFSYGQLCMSLDNTL